VYVTAAPRDDVAFTTSGAGTESVGGVRSTTLTAKLALPAL
jgi:hypothetical protein